MKNLTLRLPDDLHAALSERVDASGRSLNAEVCRLLERALMADDLTRVVREQIRQEMRAEFEARQPLTAGEMDWTKRQATAGVSHEAYMIAACANYGQFSVKD